MKAIKLTLAKAAILGLASISIASAQNATPAPTGHPGGMMGHGGMMPMDRQEMMAQHEKMLGEWKARDAQLQQKMAQMDSAQGPEKIDAMVGVIKLLVEERQQMHQHMTEMHERMQKSASAPEKESSPKAKGKK